MPSSPQLLQRERVVDTVTKSDMKKSLAAIEAHIKGMSSPPLHTPFQKAVYAACALVPRGQWASYRTIAVWVRLVLPPAGFSAATTPNNAKRTQLNSKGEGGHALPVRAVGQALSKNTLCPMPVPCHRVLATGGGIGGFSGRKEGAEVERKRRLLVEEGVIPDFEGNTSNLQTRDHGDADSVRAKTLDPSPSRKKRLRDT